MWKQYMINRKKSNNGYFNSYSARVAWLTLLLCLLIPVKPAMALLEVDITSGNIRPMPIAIKTFDYKSKMEKKYAVAIARVIADDLQNSGLFKVVDNKAYIDTTPYSKNPRFSDWRVIKVDALINGKISFSKSNQITAEFKLWDVAAQKSIIGVQFASKHKSWRRVAHLIADAIYERLTGEKGYFDTRIAFIDETGTKDKRVKRLAIMDQDGRNLVYLSRGKNLVLTPRFSPKKEELTYVSYENGLPRVYMYDIKNGIREIVGDFPDISFSPRFAPDGNKIVMSLQRDGNSNIYTRDLRTGRTERLTNTRGIDTAPSFSPDSKYIVFESDRGGSQQIYVMRADGSQQRRISFGKGRYSTPVWSPRGDYIAFTKLIEGNFLIGIMHADGSGERILTQGYHNEGPTWAPNGRLLAFFRESRGKNGGPRIYTIDITGHNERMLSTPNFSSDPSWSGSSD